MRKSVETRKTNSHLPSFIFTKNKIPDVFFFAKFMMMMMMMMMMINCFCGMVDRRKAFSLISIRDYCQRSSPSRTSDTPRAGFESAQNLRGTVTLRKIRFKE